MSQTPRTMTSAGNAPDSLWEKAFQLLDSNTQSGLNPSSTNRLDVLSAVLQEIETARNSALRKRWKFTKPNGDVVILRDVVEKIAGWVQRFKETGDVAVQYDPAHAALPWAAFRFLLQATVSEVQLFSAVATDLEDMARRLARYRMVEKLHLCGTQSEIEVEVEGALIRLYAEILTHLSHAVKFHSEKTFSVNSFDQQANHSPRGKYPLTLILLARVLKSPFRTVKEERKKALQDRELEVNQLTTLADAEILRSLEGTSKRFSMQSSALLSEEKFNDIASWLSVAPYNSHHRFIAESRLAGVGQWLLNHEAYDQWLNSSSSSIFYLYGIPGSGKSTLCSVVVDTVISTAGNDPSASPFGYFYCANPEFEKARRSCDDVLRTILFQLSIDPSSRTTVKRFLCSEYERQLARSPCGKLDMMKLRSTDCVRLILELAEEDPITIIIDGLDSFEDDDRHTLVKSLDDIVSHADNVAKIFVTSRSCNHPALVPTHAFKLQITPELTRQDMEHFVSHQIDTAVAARMLLGGNLGLETRKALEDALLDSAGEMFLWVKLHVQRICRETVEDDVVSALRKGLPESIDQIYQNSLDRISRAGDKARDLAMKVLSWVLYMREPLTPQTLMAALEPGRNSTLDATQLMHICHNLVLLDTQCNVVRFSHQSVQDFLRGNESFAAGTVHTLLASICVEACSRGPVYEQSSPKISDEFYVYASMYWPIHSKMAQDLRTGGPSTEGATLTQSIISFIFDEDWETTLSFDLWMETLEAIVSNLERSHEMTPALSAIANTENGQPFALSAFGLDDVLCIVLSKVGSVNVNDKNQLGYTPIYLASTFGHTAAVTILAAYGAEINVECGKFGSPLHAACFNGHLQVVNKLLELGADIACGSIFNIALQAAFRGGQEDVAVRLVDFGSVIPNEDGYDEAMQGAALVGFTRVVQMLESSRFKLLRQHSDDKMRKRLMKAVEGGQLGVIKQFLRQSVGNRTLISEDAIAIATLHNHKDLVEFLLNQKWDPEVEGMFGTPLRTAALLDYRPLVRLLLEKGANVNASGSFGDALQAAALKGHSSIARLLIQEGADVNQRTGFYGSALQAAAYHGQLATVELLLDAKTDADFLDDAFTAAAASGHEDVIMLMLQKGYSCQRNYRYCRSMCMRSGEPRYRCLWTAALVEPQQTQIVGRPVTTHKIREPLVDFQSILGGRDAELTQSPSPGQWRWLSRQSSQQQEEAMEDVHALQAAASEGHLEIFKILLEHTDVLGISHHDISSALDSAAETGHLSIVRHIVETKPWNPIDFYIRRILSGTSHTDIVTYALKLASQYLPAKEYEGIRAMSLQRTHTYRRACGDKSVMIPNFIRSCKDGDAQLLTMILETGDHKLLSSKALESGLQLCAQHGNLAIAQMLVESPHLQDRKPTSGEEVFLIAAASGFKMLLELFVAHWPTLLLPHAATAMGRALTSSSENGHVDVVRYLVLDMNVDVNSLSLDRAPRLRYTMFADTSLAMDIYPYSGNDLDDWRPQGTRTDEDVRPRSISPLQASLRGFVKFDDESNWDRPMAVADRTNLRHTDQKQHELVLTFLLKRGAKPNDLGGQLMYPIQFASKHCPEYIVDLLISGGADTNVESTQSSSGSYFYNLPYRGDSHLGSENNKNALYAATGRELSTLSLVRKLIRAGANLPCSIAEQNSLLQQGLRYFRGPIYTNQHGSSMDLSGGKFTVTPSLEYLFTEGCAAALVFLLRHMPHIKTTNIPWSLVLQMAAFIGDLKTVDLLLARGTDVNHTGFYCGTALQAASSRGQDKVVQRLLYAGAHANIVAGRWGTPLRASLVANHERTVEILLEHGAELDRVPASQISGVMYLKDEPQTALQLGVATGNLKIVESLLAKGASALFDPEETQHPLIMASANGSAEIVKALIQAGAPMDIHGKKRPYHGKIQAEDASSMHAASSKGHLDVVKVLLDNGANIDFNDGDVGTPLAVASAHGRATVVRHLLSAGARDTNQGAFKNAINYYRVEVVRALLEAGAQASSMLSAACKRGHTGMIELLIESISDKKSLDIALDEAFSIDCLEDSVIQLLLRYAAPTAARFARVCAVGSLSSVKSMLDKGAIDINLPSTKDGDYPLQVAALHLNFKVVRLLVAEGAHIECTSAGHGPPLITALEACAGWMLRSKADDRLQSIVDKLSLPLPPKPDFWEREPANYMYSKLLSECEAIVQLLIDHEANVADVGRRLGSPLHVACLVGSRTMVEKLMQSGVDLNATAGYFEKPIFAAIYGKHADIVSILLKHAPTPNHTHIEYDTPLHHACAVDDAQSVRKLLECGADPTFPNRLGHTPLTLALQSSRSWNEMIEYRHKRETSLDVILSMVESLCVSDHDLVAACESGGYDREKVISMLLRLDKSTAFHEDVMCRVLSSRYAGAGIIKLLMPRTGGIGVTDRMLKSGPSKNVLEELIKHRPVSKITAEVLLVQESLECMEILLQFDCEALATEQVVLRALTLADFSPRGTHQGQVLTNMFKRNPELSVTQDMLKAAWSLSTLEILLGLMKPEARIYEDTLNHMMSYGSRNEGILPLLLKHDSSIQPNGKIVLKYLKNSNWPIHALEGLLDCRPSMVVTPEMFLLALKPSEWEENTPLKLLNLLEKHGKLVMFTDEVRAAIDQACQLTSEVSKKERFYELRAVEARQIDKPEMRSTSSEMEPLTETGLGRKSFT